MNNADLPKPREANLGEFIVRIEWEMDEFTSRAVILRFSLRRPYEGYFRNYLVGYVFDNGGRYSVGMPGKGEDRFVLHTVGYFPTFEEAAEALESAGLMDVVMQ